MKHYSYWKDVWEQFKRRPTGTIALMIVALFVLVGIYAPFLASSKPIVVHSDGTWYFPLFRYLFFPGFFSKRIDLFYNLLMFTFPVMLLTLYFNRFLLFSSMIFLHLTLYAFIIIWPSSDPASDPILNLQRYEALQQSGSWDFDLRYMTSYRKLNILLRHQNLKTQQERLAQHVGREEIPTLWHMQQTRQKRIIEQGGTRAQYLFDKNEWIEQGSEKISFIIWPLIRTFHWEDDAGGEQALNKILPWWELTRINRKDLLAALIFGVRISLLVGVLSMSLAMAIGIPVGAIAGFYGGKCDIVVSRMLEIWESMPTFFMLLMVVAVTQSKSVFIVITVIGIFGWTGFSRYIRGEFFKQRTLPYVEACQSMGFSDRYTMFKHILPNAIPPLLTLLPFAIMGAISSEAGLSFLGLGEEGSCSWGVLMDEGRRAFPGESYLLWPPAIMLTLLLISIALVGDALRDAIDPRLRV